MKTFAGLVDLDRLDPYLEARGWSVPPVPQPTTWTVADSLDVVEANRWSRTWSMSDEQRVSAVRQARAWVTERHGDPARTPLPSQPIRWHAYRRS